MAGCAAPTHPTSHPVMHGTRRCKLRSKAQNQALARALPRVHGAVRSPHNKTGRTRCHSALTSGSERNRECVRTSSSSRCGDRASALSIACSASFNARTTSFNWGTRFISRSIPLKVARAVDRFKLGGHGRLRSISNISGSAPPRLTVWVQIHSKSIDLVRSNLRARRWL